MAKYINAEAFLEHRKRTIRYFDVKSDIENFPAADVAPVVRCKDCEYSFYWGNELACSNEDVLCDFVKEDFYCAYGIEKDRSKEDVRVYK